MEGVAVDVSGDDGWCERLWTIADFAARKFDIFPFALEPLNSASSLIYSVLGLSGLIALEDPFYRVCMITHLVLGIGSAAHHARPDVPETHPVDLIPTILAAGISLIYVLPVAVAVTRPKTRLVLIIATAVFVGSVLSQYTSQ